MDERADDPAVGGVVPPGGSVAAPAAAATAVAAGPAPDVALADRLRLRSLSDCGLTNASDADMERFVAQVCEQLGVPVALVSLVEATRQVFPGMAGLPEPWSTWRSTPLSHSFCRHVVATAEPLVVPDARLDPLVCDNLAIPDLGVVAYAGMPLTDAHGRVLGSLCAIDGVPRAWTHEELARLRTIARACSTELRLRLARHDADRERERTDELQDRLASALRRSELLLTTVSALMGAESDDDVLALARRLSLGRSAPVRSGLVLLPGAAAPQATPVSSPGALAASARPPTGAPAAGSPPAAPAGPAAVEAARTRRLVHAADPTAIAALLGDAAAARYAAEGVRSVAAVPVVGARGPLGVLELAWDRPDPLEAPDLDVLAATVDHVAHALDRLQFVQGRISVAHALQTAMLSEVPRVDGLDLAARYRPASRHELVGGDWYDVVPLPGDRLALVVGDVTGHDIHAAATMGQLRPMLRQACRQLAGEPPSAAITALDAACAGLGIRASGTLVLAHLAREATGGWSVTWSNAGHPPPLAVRADGSIDVLGGRDLLLGVPRLARGPRRDRTARLEPGDALVLHTDGLVERRGGSADDAAARVHAALAAHAGGTASALADAALAACPPPTATLDDVVVLTAVASPAPPH